MSIKYYSCELLSDIVINASLATEGNMRTLDYIPGSNFWGIVAGQYYGNLTNIVARQYHTDPKENGKYHKLFDLFHNGIVSFGDAHIALEGKPSYCIPFSLFQKKLEMDIIEHPTYLHHLLVQRKNRAKADPHIKAKLKQQRSGYFTSNYTYTACVKKTFALKSAQDRITRKSADEQMFGFQSIQAGQVFIFSVTYKNDEYIPLVEKALLGRKSVGKSKNAQYGQVMISSIAEPEIFTHQNPDSSLLLVYALSNICLVDEYGSTTLQPDPKRDFIIDGTVDWACSQIRTYSYSPWNNYRKTTDPQRDCILKGSVIAIRCRQDVNVHQLPNSIGNYQAEGLGKVLYNPIFLNGDPSNAQWSIQLKPYKETNNVKKKLTLPISPIGRYLAQKKTQSIEELKISKAGLLFLNTSKKDFKEISNSQWGTIRSAAIKATDTADLKQVLFGTNKAENIHLLSSKGMLTQGVAAQRYWDKRNGKARAVLWDAIEEHADFAPTFLAKFASEKAKQKKSN